jgi:diguanylate cyclase (GGDEF)-like protein
MTIVDHDGDRHGLRDLPLAGAAFFWLTQAAAAGAVAVGVANQPISADDIAQAGLLAAAALLHAELMRKVERFRRRADTAAHVDLNSTWSFAASLLLPLPLAAALNVLIYTHVWLRVRRTPPYQRIHNTAMHILTVAASTAIFSIGGGGPVVDAVSTPRGALLVLAAAAGYAVVNVVVFATWLALTKLDAHPLRAVIGTPADNALEGATLCLGVFVALVVDHNPLLVIVGLPLVLILHRNEIVHQLEEKARTDAKTGLWNAATWADRARDEIGRAERRSSQVGVLLLDLDLFKKVNDTYGHLAGDEVLLRLARTLGTEVRPTDWVGRFGGEEFVVLMPDTTVRQMEAIAERIRRCVEGLAVQTSSDVIHGLTVSIGAAAYPVHGMDLDELLEAADKALYRAKNNGRNQTQLARRPGY